MTIFHAVNFINMRNFSKFGSNGPPTEDQSYVFTTENMVCIWCIFSLPIWSSLCKGPKYEYIYVYWIPATLTLVLINWLLFIACYEYCCNDCNQVMCEKQGVQKSTSPNLLTSAITVVGRNSILYMHSSSCQKLQFFRLGLLKLFWKVIALFNAGFYL